MQERPGCYGQRAGSGAYPSGLSFPSAGGWAGLNVGQEVSLRLPVPPVPLDGLR